MAEGLVLPAQAVTETFGILAVRGAGKSNTAVVMAEAMFKAGLPFVAVDPKGDWWGIRSSQDGKKPGLQVVIFGGKHGDLPLERNGGAYIADLIADERLSCVLDLSAFESESAKKEFLLDFADRLYRKNEAPLHLFLDEADDYIPQKPMRDEARLLRAWENIVRRGRQRGIGCTFITQRSAVLNKNVLTQVETLIAMRITSPQDRAAIAAWLQYHGGKQEILESLSSLQPGEAWVWSPHFLGITERVHFLRRSTYDSGKTPGAGETLKVPSTLATIDLGKVQVRMSEAIERAKADDPKLLRKRIAELEKAARTVPPPVVADTPDLDELRKAAYRDGYEAAESKWSPIAGRLRDRALQLLRESHDLLSSYEESFGTPVAEAKPTAPKVQQITRLVAPASVKTERPVVPPTKGHVSLSQQRILNAIADLEYLGLSPVEKHVVAIFANQSPTSSGYTNNLGYLRNQCGLIDYPAGGMVALTESGKGIAQGGSIPPSLEALQQAWLGRVSHPQRRILEILIACYPGPMSKQELSERSGQSFTSSGFTNNLGYLRNSLRLIDYPSGGMAVATALLFPEGLR